MPRAGATTGSGLSVVRWLPPGAGLGARMVPLERLSMPVPKVPESSTTMVLALARLDHAGAAATLAAVGLATSLPQGFLLRE